MGTPNTNQVGAASPNATGGLKFAPLGTALPTDEATPLNAAFKGAGYIGEDGLTPSGDAPDTDDKIAWGGTNVATLVTSKGTRKFQFTLWSYLDTDVNKLIYGDANVTETEATSNSGKKLAIQDKLDIIAKRVFVADMFYGVMTGRLVMPNSQLVMTGEQPYVHTDLMGYECELTALPDASGVSVYRYWNDGVKTA